jgi:hypothetical protein
MDPNAVDMIRKLNRLVEALSAEVAELKRRVELLERSAS